MHSWFSSSGGGGIATFCTVVLVIIASIWFIAEVIAPIIRYLMPGVEL